MKRDEVKRLIKDLPFLHNYRKMIKVNKGWSKDEKFFIENEVGKKFLLRISPIEYLDMKQKEFNMMQEVYKLGIFMSAPIDFGICNHAKNVYLLLSWIDGTALDEVIATFSEEQQYDLGVQAGRILKRFHSIPAPDEQENWEQRMLKKFKIHIEKYKASGIKIANDDRALNYIKENIYLLRNRPQTFHHGDFHIGNLILTSDNSLGVIDFNRWDYGDPFEDFYKMMLFSRELSIPFAKGQIEGYFNVEIPHDFFQILALYLADVILYSVVWAIPFGEENVKGMIKRAEMIFTDYDYFHTVVPKWFTT